MEMSVTSFIAALYSRSAVTNNLRRGGTSLVLTDFIWGSCKRMVMIPFKSRGFESAAVIDYRAGSGLLF